jgi:protein-disulfide isomerase
MTQETKMIVGIGLGTLAIFAAIVFAVTKTSPAPVVSQIVDEKVLVREDSYKISTSTATVTMVEFADFQCEACRAAQPGVKLLLEDYKGKINFVSRYFPLPGHQHSRLAAQAVEAAGEQGKVWEIQDMLFEKQDEWGGDAKPATKAQVMEYFLGYARTLGLNVDQFKQAIESGKFEAKISRDFADAEALNLTGTPTFFINGKKMLEAPSYANLKKAVDQALAQ